MIYSLAKYRDTNDFLLRLQKLVHVRKILWSVSDEEWEERGGVKVQLHSFLASVLEEVNGLLHAPHALTKAGTKYVAEREIQLV